MTSKINKLITKVETIRAQSNPESDCDEVLELHTKIMDALYRLSFTADKLTAKQVDMVVNILQRREGEITVLLGRIRYVKEKGFSYQEV